MENEMHFIFRCPIYYKIRGRLHCLLRGPQTLADFFQYPDQRCLALYIQEALRFRVSILQTTTRPDTTQKITAFFSVLPPNRGTKRPTNMDTKPISRSVRISETVSRPTRSQQQVHTRSLLKKPTRSSRPQDHAKSSWQQLSGRPAPSTSS